MKHEITQPFYNFQHYAYIYLLFIRVEINYVTGLRALLTRRSFFIISTNVYIRTTPLSPQSKGNIRPFVIIYACRYKNALIYCTVHNVDNICHVPLYIVLYRKEFCEHTLLLFYIYMQIKQNVAQIKKHIHDEKTSTHQPHYTYEYKTHTHYDGN